MPGTDKRAATGPGARAESRRRIVFVNRFYAPDQSATSQLLTDIATALAARGSEVHVVTSRQLYEVPRATLPPLESIDGVTVHRVWATRFGRAHLLLRTADYLSFYVTAFFALLVLCRVGDVLVAKTDPPLISLLGALVCRIRGARLINWMQDVFPEIAARLGVLDESGLGFRILRRVRDLSLRQAERNVVLGSRMAEFISSRGIPPSQVRIIHNWADAAAIAPLPASENTLRSELGLDGKFVVGYSGNLGRAHEFETMAGAASQLAGDPSIRFLIIGGGANFAAMRVAVAERRLDNVLFLPHQPRPRLRISLTAPDLHIVSLLPQMEGLIVPSKLYGILAAGRAVAFVGSATDEVARILAELRCGICVGVGDSVGLAHYIARLAARPALTRLLGLNGRRGFVARFGFERAASLWTETLRGAGGAAITVMAQPDAAQSIR